MIFKQFIETAISASEWRNFNIVPINKKGDKQALKSYHPVSLLSISGKILERFCFNEMFSFFIENKHLPSNQSRF